MLHLYLIIIIFVNFIILTSCEVDELFFSSARKGNISILVEYIQSGVDLGSRDAKGNTAMIIAAGRGQVQVIKTLLSYGANPEDATVGGLFDGKTSLMWAISQVINL